MEPVKDTDFVKACLDLRSFAIWSTAILINQLEGGPNMADDNHQLSLEVSKKLTATVEAWDRAVEAAKEKRS